MFVSLFSPPQVCDGQAAEQLTASNNSLQSAKGTNPKAEHLSEGNQSVSV